MDTNYKPGYFGPAYRRKDYEEQQPTPVGELCMLCQEPIAEGDCGTFQGAHPIHYECQMRSVVGSVGHQMGTCSCFGGTEDDPPGMTYRQAAIAAVQLWEAKQQLEALRQRGQSVS